MECHFINRCGSSSPCSQAIEPINFFVAYTKNFRFDVTPKKDTTPSKKKDKYRIRNWHEYNQSLVNRGSLTLWFDENAIGNWYSVARLDKPGRPDTYSDDAIRC